jgi:hypothetical protein
MKLLRRLWPYLLLVLLITANLVAWNQRQNIADWWRLRDYQASTEVAALAVDTTMTGYGQRLFYVNHPSLEDKQSFNQHCTEKTEETAVLGCYHGNRQGIYIYAVNDERLQGVREVTAAHEMLHQAYDRLSTSERFRINKLLEAYYENGLTDQAVRDKLDTYKKLQNTVLVNEMHSIFGTEVRNLPEELESYYQQYFTDRAKVVDKREAYQGEFTRRQDTVKQYDAQLFSLKGRITANKALLESEMNFLNNKEKEIAQDIAVSEQVAYEADVREYNATVMQYNALLTATRALIAQHNDIVKKRNDIAIQEQQLQQALDSRLETPTTKQ